MGQVIARLVHIRNSLKDKRLLLLGLDAAGKTSILHQLNLNETVSTIPTIGFNVAQVHYNRMVMTIWDVGGQAKLRPLWHHYFGDTDALIFVIDSCDENRVDEAKDEMFRILRNPKMFNCRIVLILLNKQDLPGAVDPRIVVNRLGLDSAIDNPLEGLDWFIQGCCAITGEGLYEGLDWLCRALKRK